MIAFKSLSSQPSHQFSIDLDLPQNLVDNHRSVHNVNQNVLEIIDEPPAQSPSCTRQSQLKANLICHQFALICFEHTISFEDVRCEIRELIYAGQKQAICEFIERQVGDAKPLRAIDSGWIWDNVLPYLAQYMFKQAANIALPSVRVLLEEDRIYVCRSKVFLLLCELFYGLIPDQTFLKVKKVSGWDGNNNFDDQLNKMKCLLHYFSQVLINEDYFKREPLSIKRWTFSQPNLRVSSIETPLSRQLHIRNHSYIASAESVSLYIVDSLDSADLQLMIYTHPESFLLNIVTRQHLKCGEAIFITKVIKFTEAKKEPFFRCLALSQRHPHSVMLCLFPEGQEIERQIEAAVDWFGECIKVCGRVELRLRRVWELLIFWIAATISGVAVDIEECQHDLKLGKIVQKFADWSVARLMTVLRQLRQMDEAKGFEYLEASMM